MKRFLAVLLIFILIPVFSGAETLITSFYPIWLLTLNLTEGLDHVTVRNLAAPAVGCLHDYQLQTADMKVLSSADASLVNGAGMEAFLPDTGGKLHFLRRRLAVFSLILLTFH